MVFLQTKPARYGKVGHAAPALFDAIATEAGPRLLEFDSQNLANPAWAFAVADHPADDSFWQRFARCCDERAAEFKIKSLCQLHQFWLRRSGEHGCSEGLPSAALLERCRVAFYSLQVRPSQLQGQVSSALASLGLCPEEMEEASESGSRCIHVWTYGGNF